MTRALLLLLLSACASKAPVASAPEAPPAPEAPVTASPVSPELAAHLDAWLADGRPDTLDEDRVMAMEPLIDWLRERQADGRPAPMIFVCTHNSRRSHMGQLWARAAAAHLGLSVVDSYSGGTEATAFNPRSVTALRGHGFFIAETGEVLGEKNVVYETTVGEGLEPVRGFSKTYGDAFNPQQDFAAVMVCSSADAACPFVEGADLRVSIPYLDPKVSDGTPEEAATYLAKSEEIGREITWLMAQAAGR